MNLLIWKKRTTMKQFLKKIAGIFEPVIRFWVFPFSYLGGKSEDFEKAFLWPVIKSYSKHSKDNFIQYTTLPKKAEKIKDEQFETGLFKDHAIILQGPIREEENFTLETVKLYIRCFPGVHVIISTWEGVNDEIKNDILNAGGILVESRKPNASGAGNINMQLTSSLAGVKKAEEIGCKYSVKTRTDQRIYSNDFLQYFSNLVKLFPSSNTDTVRERIVYISFGKSFRYLPFNLCDFISYGATSELLKLYGVRQDERKADFHKQFEDDERSFNRMLFDSFESRNEATPYDIPDFEEKYYRYMYAEYYIVYCYFCENIYQLSRGDDLMDAYYTYLQNYAIIADSEKILLYWPKYVTNIVKHETEIDFLAKLDFKKWLDIYVNYKPKQSWCNEAHADN